MDENVRLVIWDLDDTFWRGTLTEGGIDYLPQNHDIVVELARRGIPSSICSRNSLAPVRRILEEHGLWQYFVFPSVNWEPKGPRLLALIEALMLRPATVMFVDDNPANRNEARHHAPEIQIADPSALPRWLVDPRFRGKDDAGLTRLAQYRLLERRHGDEAVAKAAGATNADFLRASNIQVRFEFNIQDNADRAVELVNRTNQLNFTKQRLSEDPELARTELLALVQRYDIQAGLVHVADRYGDHGHVGFYAVKSHEGHSDLVHFCFSCRVMGMGIEAWVYRNIGRPWLPMVGEVVGDPRDEAMAPDWITMAAPTSARAAGPPEGAKGPVFERVIVRAGCNGLSIAHYFHALARDVAAEVPLVRHGVPIRLDHSLFLSNHLDGDADSICAAIEALGYRKDDSGTALFDQAIADPVVILDFWTDSEVAIYRHKRQGFRVPFVLPYHFPIKPSDNAMDLPADFSLPGFDSAHPVFQALRELRGNYEYEGLIDEKSFKSNLTRVIENIVPGARIFLVLASETWLNPGNGLIYTFPEHAALNAWAKSTTAPFANVQIVDIRQFIESSTEMETINHFDRMVYFRLCEAIAQWAVPG